MIKDNLKSGQIKSYYVLSGNELKVQDIYITKLADNLPIVRIDSFSEVARKLNANKLISSNKCYVIRDDKDILNDEGIWDRLEAIIGSNRVIWVFTSIDKRSKFYKHFKEVICEVEHMSEDVLLKYVQKEIDLSEANARILIQVCENDYGRILLEIDKIKQFGDDPNKAFMCLLKEGTIYQPPRDAIFMWADAMLCRKVKEVFGLYEECKEIGEASLTLISVLYTKVRQVFQVQSCEGRSDIAKITGLTPWQVKCAQQVSNRYSLSQLKDFLYEIRKVEKGIKIGTIPEDLAIDYLMVYILT